MSKPAWVQMNGFLDVHKTSQGKR